MTFEELKEILTNIKAHYQNFAIYDYVIEEWYKVLKDYEFDDVMESLVEHLTSDNSNELPKVYQLVKYLTPKHLKKKSDNKRFLVACNLCDRWMSLAEFDKHYDKCLYEFKYKTCLSHKIK